MVGPQGVPPIGRVARSVINFSLSVHGVELGRGHDLNFLNFVTFPYNTKKRLGAVGSSLSRHRAPIIRSQKTATHTLPTHNTLYSDSVTVTYIIIVPDTQCSSQQGYAVGAGVGAAWLGPATRDWGVAVAFLGELPFWGEAERGAFSPSCKRLYRSMRS